MVSRAYVAFLWHMHQPFYVNPVSDVAILPWVRLHAIKDYYDMAKILDFFPNMKLTFNLVPSLLIQLEQYVNKEITDVFLDYTKKEASLLIEQEKNFILNNFFLCNWEQMIRPYPRFNQLYNKKQNKEEFTTQDYLDIQVWFNLAWFGEYSKRNDDLIKRLLHQGADFNEKDKNELIAKQFELMSLIFDKYKELQDKEQIEISTSPFYHPILPLIINTDIAKETHPNITLPNNFSSVIDAERQIILASHYIEQKFGKKPVGMWPPEAAISEETLKVLSNNNLLWTASDDQVLKESILLNNERIELDYCYKPYIFKNDNKHITIFFRDSRLSDRIGFEYKNWNVDDAVNDLMSKFISIADSIGANNESPIISIILDGENAWEHYSGNAWDFLFKLYEAISKNDRLIPTTFSKYLQQKVEPKQISKIHAGSWINKGLGIWIGHEEDNQAWDMLNKTRKALEQWQESKSGHFTSGEMKRLAMAWKELYVSEGSDWNWWYGDDYSSRNDKEFDELFRQHLLNVYEFIGLVTPASLYIPIKKLSQTKAERNIKGVMSPVIDGLVTDYYEWLNAGCYDCEKIRGNYLQKGVVNKIFFGYDLKNVYFRLDINKNMLVDMQGINFIISILAPKPCKITIPFSGKCSKKILQCKKGKEYKVCENNGVKSIYDKVIEVSIPFEDIDLKSGHTVQFIISLENMGTEVERWPIGNIIEFVIPTLDDSQSNWII